MTKATGEAARAALERRALLAARALIDHVRSLYRELEQLTGAPITANRVPGCLRGEPGITAAGRAVRRARLAARALIDHVRSRYRELEQLTGAPITANRVLVCLGEEPGITASRLAGALGMQRPALSQVLKGLVERGWIERERDESDQR